MAREVSTYTTNYGGTGTTVRVTNPDGTFYVYSTPDDQEAAARYRASLASGRGGVGSSTGSSSLDTLLAGLTGPGRDAAVALTNLFQSYGLGSLAPKIVQFIQQGYAPDTVTILLQQTPEYKQRFSANDARVKAGLPALSPAEYLATESAYRQIMRAAGLPEGFYDTPSDFSNFIARDVSPTEVQDRVSAASNLINNAPPEALAMFKQFYSTGDIIAYALDPTRAAPLVEKRVKAAELAGVGAQQGVGVDVNTAERLATSGVTSSQAQAGFGFIAGEQPTVDKLNAIYGGDDVTEQDLVSETFFNDASATRKRKRLASKERATFGGSSGLTSQSLDRNDAGAF